MERKNKKSNNKTFKGIVISSFRIEGEFFAIRETYETKDEQRFKVLIKLKKINKL